MLSLGPRANQGWKFASVLADSFDFHIIITLNGDLISSLAYLLILNECQLVIFLHDAVPLSAESANRLTSDLLIRVNMSLLPIGSSTAV
jgi:hypothetical protein